MLRSQKYMALICKMGAAIRQNAFNIITNSGPRYIEGILTNLGL
jgi:hypothetical protein